MAEITAVCGKICSGKTFYCRRLLHGKCAVLLSCDELLSECFRHAEIREHDIVLADTKRFLHKKAAEIVRAGTDVVLDWGFWTKAERDEVSAMYRALGIPCKWHYIDIPDDEWRTNILQRNKLVKAGLSSDYYVDEGLLRKLAAAFEPPERSEIDIWHDFTRIK